MINNALSIKIAEDPKEAPNYNEIGGYKSIKIDTALIVKNGTQAGKPTVDLQLEDENGNKFVALLTGQLIISLADAVKVVGERENANLN